MRETSIYNRSEERRVGKECRLQKTILAANTQIWKSDGNVFV